MKQNINKFSALLFFQNPPKSQMDKRRKESETGGEMKPVSSEFIIIY